MAGHIPWRVVDLTLAATRSIWISTTRPDGRPHAMPVWFWWDGSEIYFITQRSTQKARDLASQSWTVVHAGDGDDVVILEGRAEIVTDPDDLERVDAAYREKYVDPGSGATATIFNEGDDCYRVRIEHVWDDRDKNRLAIPGWVIAALLIVAVSPSATRPLGQVGPGGRHAP